MRKLWSSRARVQSRHGHIFNLMSYSYGLVHRPAVCNDCLQWLLVKYFVQFPGHNVPTTWDAGMSIPRIIQGTQDGL